MTKMQELLKMADKQEQAESADLRQVDAGVGLPLDEMLNDMPENRNIYKDSGLWQIWDDDSKKLLYQQGADENTYAFFERAYNKENVYMDYCRAT